MPFVDDGIETLLAAHRHSLTKLKKWIMQEVKENGEFELVEFLQEVRTDEEVAKYPDLVKELATLGAGAQNSVPQYVTQRSGARAGAHADDDDDDDDDAV